MKHLFDDDVPQIPRSLISRATMSGLSRHLRGGELPFGIFDIAMAR